jgi:hypothetical protein
MKAMVAATATKITERTTARGGPLLSRPPPKKIRSLPLWVISTGKKRTKATREARASGAQTNRFPRRPARRKPRPIPRKLPRSTKFEK